MQFMVQGAWGIVPAHLNELSPPSVRAILPGFAYQLRNLLMARAAPSQAGLAEARVNDYSSLLAAAIAIVGVVLAVFVMSGNEASHTELIAS